MKKFLAVVLTVVTSISLVACGGKKEPDDAKNPTDTPVPTESTENPGSGTTDNTNTPSEAIAKDAVELLSTIWASYGEDETFPSAGGDFDKGTMGKPDSFTVENNGEALDMYFNFPADATDKIDGAASLTHMMNLNTFTCAAFHVKDNADVQGLVDKIKANVMAEEWMCGFPDKLVMFTADNYIISVFGNEEMVDTFKAKAQAAYGSLTLVCDDPIL